MRRLTPKILGTDLFGNSNLIFSIFDLGFGNIPVIEVIRTSDNQIQTFTATQVFQSSGTAGSLLNFCIGTDGLITKHFNHLGVNHANISSKQHKIVNNGNLILKSGIPVIEYNTDTNSGYNLDTQVNVKSLYTISKIDTYNTVNYIAGLDTPNRGFFTGGTFSGVNGIGAFDGTNIRSDNTESLDIKISYHEIRGNTLFVQTNNNNEQNVGNLTVSEIPIDMVFGKKTTTSFQGSYNTLIAFNEETSDKKNAIINKLNQLSPIF